MAEVSIPIDAQDEKKQKLFFPSGIEIYLFKYADWKFWYFRYLHFVPTYGSLDCCSDMMYGFSYLRWKEMFRLDYLIFDVHPFGLDGDFTEEEPRKLTMDEIKTASKAKSNRNRFKKQMKYAGLLINPNFATNSSEKS